MSLILRITNTDNKAVNKLIYNVLTNFATPRLVCSDIILKSKQPVADFC